MMNSWSDSLKHKYSQVLHVFIHDIYFHIFVLIFIVYLRLSACKNTTRLIIHCMNPNVGYSQDTISTKLENLHKSFLS